MGSPRLWVVLALLAVPALAEDAPNWNAPDRGAKVAALIPGRRLAGIKPETLFADWCAGQVQRWAKDHPALPPAQAFAQYAAAPPADATLVADFPRHISPFARVRSGQPEGTQAADALIHYCPFCGSHALALTFDERNPYHATTNCCRTELYGRAADYPAGYALKANGTGKFRHLDDQWVEVPCTVYRDQAGVVWELYLKTLCDQRRWLQVGCDLVTQFGRKFAETADPVYAHKIAVLLDQVADTYYGLPLSFENELAKGKDGQPLTRAEWEAVPRPAIFEVSYLGGWNRRTPIFNKGWINMSGEHIWVEPYAQVRHHPAFRNYSQQKYGSPDALDAKIRTRLLRELALMFKSVFSQKLLTNYQEANYVDLWMLGVLLQDRELLDFAGPAQEVAMYNHSYQDGLNGEGAPNYMAMPGGYFYPYLRDPQGWLRFYPDFATDQPFFHAADSELRKLTTVRGAQVEFGDQHEYAGVGGYLTDAARVRANERVGSRNWAGYGVGILRVGGPGHRQELCLSYARASLHNAQDALSLECWVDGVPVMRRGGYAAYWHNAYLQWQRPEFQALRKMDYPHEIVEGPHSGGWTWDYSHSALSQNGAMVDHAGTGRGWGDNRGYGEVITAKGGEAQGEPGSEFQVLDVKDHYSWSRVDRTVTDFRRTLLGVEGPDGRPYVIDLLKLTGGRRHTLYNSAWAERAEDHLPPATGQAADLSQALFGAQPPAETADTKDFRQVRKVERLGPAGATWDLTWRTDLAAYAPRPTDGQPFVRPLAADVGRVRLRLVGVGGGELLRAKGPWIGNINQPLPGGQGVHGNVAFLDARDFLIESRQAKGDQPLDSLFCHVLEGYREGEASVIKSVEPLVATSLSGPARQLVALRLTFTDGHRDTVLYQSEAGAVRLPDGLTTDARYALVRDDAGGAVIGASACRGTWLARGAWRAELAGDFTGTIVDVIGDLTGTRRESALVIRPTRPWPAGVDLHDRQLLVRFESALREPGNEGWRVESVAPLPGGLVKVTVQDHAPFATSWHQVTVLPADRPNVLRTWRPMVDHGNSPWYHGLQIWFPERGRTYTIQKAQEVGGGYGGDTLELAPGTNLAADGIQLGDWYVVQGVRPGLQVTVANDFCWRREPAKAWQQQTLRATGGATVTAPETAGPLAWRAGTGPWQRAAGKAKFTAEETAGQAVRLLRDAPAWLDLSDLSAPVLQKLELDGRAVTPEQAKDLGWCDPPRRLVCEFRQAGNQLDPAATVVRLNDQPVPAALVVLTPQAAGRGVRIEVDLQRALAPELARPRRHGIEVGVTSLAVEPRSTLVTLSFIAKVPLETGVVYLSDLKPLRSFAHGGLITDHDYIGNPAEIAGRMYPKCLTLCPEPSPDGTHGEAVYAVPAGRLQPVFRAEVGISTSARDNGSATFQVQASASADGPWQTLFSSATLRGGQAPQAVEVPLGAARFLRLWTTDAGDGINSDHAVWGNARLK